jgi:hypothetical protein
VVDGGPNTLTAIALRTGVTVTDLVRLNRLPKGITLASGQTVLTFRGIQPAQLAVLPADLTEALMLRRIP